MAFNLKVLTVTKHAKRQTFLRKFMHQNLSVSFRSESDGFKVTRVRSHPSKVIELEFNEDQERSHGDLNRLADYLAAVKATSEQFGFQL